jgi:hypothetical protein
MKRRSGLAAALMSALLLAVMVATATATTFTVVERAIRANWSTMTFESSGASVRCPVTLEGSFTQGTFAKVARSRIGNVTRGVIGTCTGGTARILAETLPWTIQYSSFAGTLPNITSVTMRMVGGGFQITPTGGPTCTARSTEESPIVMIGQREGPTGKVTGLRIEEANTIPLSGEALCSFLRGRIIGTSGAPTVLGETTPIVMLLGAERAMQGATEAETEPIRLVKDLEIERASTLGVRSITNANFFYDVTITAILKIEGNPERFAFLRREEAPSEDCLVGTILRPRSANACNIRIGYTGGGRPTETKVVITYEWGRVLPYPREQNFTVHAN